MFHVDPSVFDSVLSDVVLPVDVSEETGGKLGDVVQDYIYRQTAREEKDGEELAPFPLPRDAGGEALRVYGKVGRSDRVDMSEWGDRSGDEGSRAYIKRVAQERRREDRLRSRAGRREEDMMPKMPRSMDDIGGRVLMQGGWEAKLSPHARCACPSRDTRRGELPDTSLQHVAHGMKAAVLLASMMVKRRLIRRPPNPLPVLPGKRRPCPCSVIGPTLRQNFLRYTLSIKDMDVPFVRFPNPRKQLERVLHGFVQKYDDAVTMSAQERVMEDHLRRTAEGGWLASEDWKRDHQISGRDAAADLAERMGVEVRESRDAFDATLDELNRGGQWVADSVGEDDEMSVRGRRRRQLRMMDEKVIRDRALRLARR